MAIADGHYDLEISLAPPKDREIVRVSAEVLSRVENVESLRVHPEEFALFGKDVGWVEGQPFLVEVWCSRRSTGIGRELSYAQQSVLLLRVEFQRGAPEYIVVQIPDGRVKRTVSVSVPDS